eukprot:scaffold7427_cov54-Attheya_sp.AAC.1
MHQPLPRPETTRPKSRPVDEAVKCATRLYKWYQTTDKALKKQIETAIDQPYLAELCDQLTGFNQVSAFNLLEHLYDNYGLIDDVDLETNQWDHTFANIGDQGLTDGMLISKRITLLSNTMVFNDNIKDLNRLDTKEKMWANFKSHFQWAHQHTREYKKAVTMARQGGYNALVHNVYDTMLPSTMCKAKLKMTQLVPSSKLPMTPSAPSWDESGLAAELAQANAVLTATNITMAAQMAQLMSRIQLLQTQMAARPAGAMSTTPKWTWWAYYWLHGKCKHSGKDCQKKKDGHNNAATMEDRMGGSHYNL